ncbi:hypothetical protein [Spirosoma areae]
MPKLPVSLSNLRFDLVSVQGRSLSMALRAQCGVAGPSEQYCRPLCYADNDNKTIISNRNRSGEPAEPPQACNLL